MANLSNLNNKFIVTDGNNGRVLIGATNDIGATLFANHPSTTAPSLTFNAPAGQVFENEDLQIAFGLNNASPYNGYMQTRFVSAPYYRNLAINPLGGNVGIGTNSPSYPLEVNGQISISSATGPQLLFFEPGRAYTDGMRLLRYQDKLSLTYGWNANEEALTVVGGTGSDVGNVGIGTTSPNRKLTVQSGSYSFPSGIDNNSFFTIAQNSWSGMTLLASTTTGSFIDFGDTDAGWRGRILYAHNGDYMYFSTAATERMRIESTGVVKFPNTATSTGDVGTIAHYTNNYMYVRGGTAGLAIGDDGFGVSVYLNNSDSIQFNTGGTEKMRITSGGNINLGTGSLTQVSYQLRVDSDFDNGIYMSAGSSSSNYAMYIEKSAGGTSIFNVRGDGNVGIGTDSPGRGLTIDKSNQYAALEIIKNNTTNQIVYLGTGSSAGTDDPILQMKHNGTENIRLYATGNSWINGGNVGIGTDSPDFALDIEVVDAGVQLQIGRTNTNVGSAWMGASGSGFAVGVGAYGAGNSVTDPNGFLIDASGNLSTRRRIQAKTDTGVGVSVTRNLFVTWGGVSFDYTFDPVALFGANKSGGTLGLRVSGWPTRLFDGIIVWRNDGGGSSVIGSGVVTIVQIATNDFSGVGVTVSLPSSSTNQIKISFTGWHTNDHGWSCYIKNDF